jgi:cobalt-zinc-cadmium efflux system outer membrane protein
MRSNALAALCFTGWCLSAPAAQAQEPAIPPRLSLDEALRLVQQQHPALDAARERVAVANADLLDARQRPNPAFAFSAEGARPWAAGGRSLNGQETVVEIGQEVETGGRRRLRTAAGAAGASAARAALDDRWRQLRLDAARVYFELVLARLEAENAVTALAEVDKVIAVNRLRYEQGEVSGVELRRLEVERMKFGDDLLVAELNERNTRAALLSLVGAARLDAPLEPADGFGWLDPNPGPAGQAGPVVDVAAQIARALSARADLAGARRDRDRAESDLKLQHAMRLPNVTFGAGYRRDFGENGLVVSASIPLPLFNRNAGGIARADAGRRAAGALVRQAERAVSLEVQQAANTLAAMRERLRSIESEYLRKAREARDSALAAYRSGATDLTDYLDAQRAYRDVQRAHQRAQFDVRLGLLQLDAAVGTIPGEPRS